MEDGGSHRGGRPRLLPDDGGADLISALPEDLLLQVLRRLGCARAAARTSLLSRHWRDRWRHIADFTFRDVALCSLLPALRSLSLASDVFLLDIRVPEVSPDLSPLREQHAAHVSSLLRAAADLSPVELGFGVPPSTVPYSYFPSVLCHSLTLRLPCFLCATSIELHGLNLLFTELPASRCMFPALETLSLSACCVDFHAVVLQCPRLRVLRATDCLHGDQDITINSASLQELVMESRGKWTGRIDLKVPALNRLVLFVVAGGDELSVSISAPVVETVSWHCIYCADAVAGIGLWGLGTVRVQTESNVLFLLMLSLFPHSFPHTEIGLEEEIKKQLVVTDFSVLDLQFLTYGHAFGAFLFCLLRIHWIRTATKNLKISLHNIKGKEKSACPVNCPCDEPKNWRSQAISLINLEEVEIKGFEGEDYEFDILRLLFGCAPMLKRMTVKLSDEVTTSKAWCTKIDDIFKAYPYVECSGYPSTGLTNSQSDATE